nr:hypothetical protein B0A51_11885 [Rachicladosporium sp. CCFEE 5018]
MPWLDASAFQASLPDHCTPTNDFLLRFSQTFHICLPTPLAFASNLLGILSICSWLFAQLPQIYKNWSIQSTSGLSIFFLVEWCLGDLGNLLGALFTHQANWQVVIGGYYVFVDLCLVMQWVWYEKLKHGRHLLRIRRKFDGTPNSQHGGDDGMSGVIIEGVDPRPPQVQHTTQGTEYKNSRPRPIFRTPTFRKGSSVDEKASSSLPVTPGGGINLRGGPSSPMPSPSPRTFLFIACLVAMAQASPVSRVDSGKILPLIATNMPTPLETAGTVLSWLSTFLYLGSRLPQLYKNYIRKSTAGLSPHLFAAAFCGNMFYSSALLSNPRAWYDMDAFGGHGWVGEAGNNRIEWVTAALPFFLGAAGVLGLDAAVGVQFILYGESDTKLVVIEEGTGRKWRWRRVSGWMRGWAPTANELDASVKSGDREALLEARSEQEGTGYGAI